MGEVIGIWRTSTMFIHLIDILGSLEASFRVGALQALRTTKHILGELLICFPEMDWYWDDEEIPYGLLQNQ